MKILSNGSKGLKARKKLKHWIPMCEAWAFHIERYSRLTEGGDSPYNINERANVGLLAGASWASGGIALEEFQSAKGVEKKEVQGRIDLWMSNESGQEDYVEAKFKKMSVNGNYLKQIEATLNSAIEDAAHTKGDYDDSSIGVAFIIFYMKKRSPKEVLVTLDQAVVAINKNIDFDIMSWCFPDRDVVHVYDDDYIVPGVIMLGKQV